MSKKTLTKNFKTTSKTTNKDVDKEEKMKRFTIDIPATLHTKLKITAAKGGLTMKEMICNILEETVK